MSNAISHGGEHWLHLLFDPFFSSLSQFPLWYFWRILHFFFKFPYDKKILVKSWQFDVKEKRTYFIWRVLSTCFEMSNNRKIRQKYHCDFYSAVPYVEMVIGDEICRITDFKDALEITGCAKHFCKMTAIMTFCKMISDLISNALHFRFLILSKIIHNYQSEYIA